MKIFDNIKEGLGMSGQPAEAIYCKVCGGVMVLMRSEEDYGVYYCRTCDKAYRIYDKNESDTMPKKPTINKDIETEGAEEEEVEPEVEMPRPKIKKPEAPKKEDLWAKFYTEQLSKMPLVSVGKAVVAKGVNDTNFIVFKDKLDRFINMPAIQIDDADLDDLKSNL